MHDDNFDDPYGFWKDEPTRQLKRPHTGTRSHTGSLPVTRMVPVVRTDRARPIAALDRPHNPLLARVGLLMGVMLLLVPVGLSMRNDSNPVARAVEIQGTDTILVGVLPAPAPTLATVALVTDAPTTTLAPTPVPSVPPTEAAAVVATPAPTEPPTTAAPAKKAAPKPTTPATVAPAPTAAQAAEKACPTTYTIGSGDSWSAIASRAKVTMKALLAVNNATVNTLLLPGKNICLPDGAAAPGPPPAKAPATTQPAPATTQPKPAVTQPTSPPATTAPPSTQPAPPANIYSKAQVAQIIRDVWPDSLEDEAIRIATRESNLIPTVRNACCYGLFQIYYSAHRTWLAGIGVTSAAQLYDPRVNASAALALYNSSGWAPWGTTTPTTTVAA
jgi:LysM repeat protein